MEKKSVSRHQIVSTVCGFLTAFTQGMLCTVCVLVALCLFKNLFRFQFTWDSPHSCLYFKRESIQPVYTGAKGEAHNLCMSKVVWGLGTCRRRYCGAYDIVHPHCSCLFLISLYCYSSVWKLTCMFFILYYTQLLCFSVLLPLHVT